MRQNINDSVANELTLLGVTREEAIKVVVESDFDLMTSAAENPVTQF
jgi:hypothetical protein